MNTEIPENNKETASDKSPEETRADPEPGLDDTPEPAQEPDPEAETHGPERSVPAAPAASERRSGAVAVNVHADVSHARAVDARQPVSGSGSPRRR